MVTREFDPEDTAFVQHRPHEVQNVDADVVDLALRHVRRTEHVVEQLHCAGPLRGSSCIALPLFWLV
jgi:hypothetical protein